MLLKNRSTKLGKRSLFHVVVAFPSSANQDTLLRAHRALLSDLCNFFLRAFFGRHVFLLQITLSRVRVCKRLRHSCFFFSNLIIDVLSKRIL